MELSESARKVLELYQTALRNRWPQVTVHDVASAATGRLSGTGLADGWKRIDAAYAATRELQRAGLLKPFVDAGYIRTAPRESGPTWAVTHHSDDWQGYQ